MGRDANATQCFWLAAESFLSGGDSVWEKSSLIDRNGNDSIFMSL